MDVFILNIETSEKNCSVSISKNGELFSIKEEYEERFSHDEKLHAFIEQLFDESDVKISDLSAVAISKGPGSYTGLRIGVSSAKGLCYALDIPLISVETLEIMTKSVVSQFDEKYLFCPMMDARRMEVYSCIFDRYLNKMKATESVVLEKTSFSEMLKNNKICFFGSGSAKFEDIISSENAVFLDNKITSSKDMIELSYDKFLKNDFEDLAYFEPLYLKEFTVIKSKKNKL